MAKQKKKPAKKEVRLTKAGKPMPPGLKPFVKGDPRINRHGANRKIPALKKILKSVLGVDNNIENLDETELALVFKAMLETAKSKRSPLQVQAAKELLDRTFGKAKTKEPKSGGSEMNITWNETKTYKK